MLTSIFVYYLGSAVALWGSAKILEHVPNKNSSSDDYNSNPYGEGRAADGETYGTPYGS